MRIDVLTLFPEMFTSPLSASILGRAQERGIVEVCLTNIRDYATDDYRKVDDKPYGGGPGMVMMPGPVFDCFEDVCAQSLQKPRVLVLSPQGRPLTQVCVRELSREDRLVLLAGRYEGFDERIRLGLGAEQLSIGDYVLSGGELAAMVLIDAVVRLLPGALGHADSPREESFEDGLLEFPQYTRPEVFRDMSVPEVLLSGDHARIATWRREQARERTLRWRPDLLREEQ
ncbi:MAG: tRNA (guanosine(37)-N1)-methyltransferase TrmD [Planctomycetes bacterium]|nr:tRNA (guanosine(37)-N1)-methyltransferase TrmD [Planctomycetota bacterium]